MKEVKDLKVINSLVFSLCLVEHVLAIQNKKMNAEKAIKLMVYTSSGRQ